MANRGRPRKTPVEEVPIEEPVEEMLEAAEPSIDFADAEEPASKSTLVDGFKAKISGFFKADPVDFEVEAEEPKRGRGRPPKQAKTSAADEFMAIALPLMTMALKFLLELPFRGVYTPVAPTKPEVHSIALPPLRMMARRMKLEKMSPDAWDLGMLVVAISTYTERALQTARDINQTQLERQGGYGNDRGDTTRGPTHTASPGDAGYGGAFSNGANADTGSGHVFGYAPAPEAEPPQDEDSGVTLIRGLLEQDADGRRRLGIG